MVFGLFVGAIVEITGAYKFFNYDMESYDQDNLDRFIKNKGEGEYELIDEAIFEFDREEEKKVWVFGYKNGNKNMLNKSEMYDFDTFGDIVIVSVDKNNNPINLTFDELEEMIAMDLDDYEDTESHLEENNEYDFTDGWLINDLDYEEA